MAAFREEGSGMETRIIENIRELVEAVKNNPDLQKIFDEDPKPEINLLLHNHIQDPAFLVGYDFLKLNLRTAKMLKENKYDINKIRRRIEEHLRKYATDQDIIKLALFYDVSIK